MTVYYLTYASLIVANLIFSKLKIDEKKQKGVFCAFFFIVITCLLGLRHQCMGVDLGYGYNNGYLASFDKINALSWSQVIKLDQYLNYEKGFIVFNKIVGSIYNDRQFYLMTCAFVTFLPIALYINRKSELPLLSAIIYMGLPVFLMSYSGLRQSIAIGITVFSMIFVEKKKIFPFILTVIFATTFHYSSMAFFIAYFLYYIRLNDLYKMICVLVVPGIYILKVPIFKVISKIFKESAAIEETGAFIFFAVIYLIYIFLILFKNDENKEIDGVINLFYVAVICQIFGSINNLAQRVGYYFMVYAAIAVPSTILNLKNKGERKLMYVVVLLAFVIFGLWCIKSPSWYMSYPYYSFWSEEVFW